ncbi:tRNA (adenosine(37)-N6)-threonylcarbamoyltransferase complex dimerization subunit type 1 TsaB [Fervidobacterium islandicum]|uniref:tRNA (Adenosine(37)-N6)-threonylcarbamoyltransferase complex dimerization subunit type 1 TsaB n=1 Tax=Fervidobacterium islandicum TaxID=2423 RepID=A0AAI8CKK7_FERIS|nr:tRNA (adenosine(37)-N6)-threonylcarbamoyltransferase complex dimerization subunit type 1 TsaB [Fervidobacterium islandicum]AMW33104.1 tRNA (adenosine(37)-N6)-threonylcarbamoyltransferase complex dimerization subunit type 1 TsaB [Fervidobacterium islandicum]
MENSSNLKVFSLDTSSPRVVACYFDSEKKIMIELETKAKHGIQVSQVVEKLKEVDFNSLDVIGVGIGPGGLTGLRVGISFALGLGIGKRFVRISSLKLIAMNALASNGYIGVVRKAREGYLYAGLYHAENGKLHTLVEPFIESIDVVRERFKSYNQLLLLGDGAEYFKDYGIVFEQPTYSQYNFPSVRNLYLLTIEEIANGNFVDALHIEPLYLQKSIAELNFEKKLKQIQEK